MTYPRVDILCLKAERAGRRALLAAQLALGIALSGCAGPIETYTSLAGSGLAGGGNLSAVPLVVSTPHEKPGAVSQQARDVVVEELVAQGYTVADRGGPTLLVTIAERPATTATRAPQGDVLSGDKHGRLFQSCADRTHRLTLVLVGVDGEVSRASAEERHCKGTLAQSLKPLAHHAVATLAGKQAAGVTVRSGRD